MIPEGQPLPPGYCAHCRIECRDCTGREIWPGREDLADKVVWVCPQCGARVGSHDATGVALGTAANPELRRAREMLHGRLDPLWLQAHRSGAYAGARDADEAERRKRLAIIKRTARKRVYEFLAARLGVTKDECHVAMFDIYRCRAAWVALRGVTYDDVRAWAHEAKKKPASE